MALNGVAILPHILKEIRLLQKSNTGQFNIEIITNYLFQVLKALFINFSIPNKQLITVFQ